MTMALISTITVGVGGATSVTFSNIPQTGTDLLLVSSDRTNRTQDTAVYYQVQLNGSGGFTRVLQGTGSSVTSYTNAYVMVMSGSNQTSGAWASSTIYIPNYTSTVAKLMNIDSVNEANDTSVRIGIHSGLSTSTAAVTSITLAQVNATNFLENSVFSLYSITKGSGGATVS